MPLAWHASVHRPEPLATGRSAPAPRSALSKGPSSPQAMKLALKGIVLHRGAYLRNPWDVLDGTIVVTSLLSMIAPNIAFFRTMRLLRVLRPLRMIRRVKVSGVSSGWSSSRRPQGLAEPMCRSSLQGMRMVVETLLRSMPEVANVLLFGGFMFRWAGREDP